MTMALIAEARQKMLDEGGNPNTLITTPIIALKLMNTKSLAAFYIDGHVKKLGEFMGMTVYTDDRIEPGMIYVLDKDTMVPLW